MKTLAKIEFSGPNYCCFAAINWPLQNLARSNSGIPVLRIQKSAEVIYYVSVISSGNESTKGNRNILKLNGKFGRALGLVEGEEIFVEEISSGCNPVKRTLLSCVSPNDWEILESNAETVSSKLLDQLRVVNQGLKFPFWVTKSISIDLKIEKIDSGMEFGLLTDSSEIEIPALKSHSEPFRIYDSRKILRIHPITFPSSTPLSTNSTLLFNNIHHAFTFKNSMPVDQLPKDEDSPKYIYAQIVLYGPLFNHSKNDSLVVKIFFLDYVDCSPLFLRLFGTVTNPPCLFLHPKFITKYKLQPKTYIVLEQVNSKTFENVPSQYSPVDNSNISKTEKKFGGYTDLVDECCNFLKASLSLGNIRHGLIGPVGSLLITGKPGSGKTTFSQHVVCLLEEHPYFIHWEVVNCSRLRGKKPETVEKELQSVFSKASQMAPAVVILDDLDIITSVDKSDQQNLQEEFLHYKTCETIAECILEYNGHQITIIGTAETEEKLNSYWKSRPGFHLFQKSVCIPPANKLDRLQIFQICTDRYLRFTDGYNVTDSLFNENTSHSSMAMKKFCQSKNESMKSEINCVLSTLHDHYATPRIIENISRKWALHILDCSANSDINLPLPSCDTDLNKFKQIIQEELQFCEEYSHKNTNNIISWDKIGGMKDIKHEIKKILEWPIKYPMLFDNAPIKMPTGILLYGYPGTGKTLLGLTIPAQVNAKLIHIKGPELLSKYIGASEQAVQDVFARARNSKPCILFFDEFDSLVPRRGHDSTGVTDRVVNQFLAEMDGIEGGLGLGVYLIAATSRPDLIDPAVLRPGRLDKHLFFDLPTKEERFDILKNISSQVNHSYDESDMDAISCLAKGFTGADMHALICSSQLTSVQEYLGELQLNGSYGVEDAADAETLEKDDIAVTREHLETVFKTFKPTLHGEELLKFRTIYQSFSGKNDGSIPTGGRFIIETGKRATLA